MIRKPLYDAGVTQGDLGPVWNVKPATVKTIMMRKAPRPTSSQYIGAVVELLKLDDFGATELPRQAAREAGYKIDGPSPGDSPTWRKP